MEKIKTNTYFEATGRRKTSVARVRIFPESSGKINHIIVNEKDYKDYFPLKEMQFKIEKPLKLTGLHGLRITAKIKGGGIHSQSEALRHGIGLALIKINDELRKILKPEGILKRDSRMKERRKFGLKKARKAPQWSKR